MHWARELVDISFYPATLPYAPIYTASVRANIPNRIESDTPSVSRIQPNSREIPATFTAEADEIIEAVEDPLSLQAERSPGRPSIGNNFLFNSLLRYGGFISSSAFSWAISDGSVNMRRMILTAAIIGSLGGAEFAGYPVASTLRNASQPYLNNTLLPDDEGLCALSGVATDSMRNGFEMLCWLSFGLGSCGRARWMLTLWFTKYLSRRAKQAKKFWNDKPAMSETVQSTKTADPPLDMKSPANPAVINEPTSGAVIEIEEMAPKRCSANHVALDNDPKRLSITRKCRRAGTMAIGLMRGDGMVGAKGTLVATEFFHITATLFRHHADAYGE